MNRECLDLGVVLPVAVLAPLPITGPHRTFVWSSRDAPLGSAAVSPVALRGEQGHRGVCTGRAKREYAQHSLRTPVRAKKVMFGIFRLL